MANNEGNKSLPKRVCVEHDEEAQKKQSFTTRECQMTSNEENESPPKRICVEHDEEAQKKQSFTPREYQVELLEFAKDHNTIACLGTGTGKTFIAVMLIRELADAVRVSFENGGKKIIFLVPTVPLVVQQAKVIEQHTDLKVCGYYGEMDVDSWSKDRWQEEFKAYEVLVMTAEICRIIFHHSFLPLDKVRLIIFDECHRAQGKNHPYRETMKCFAQCPPEDMPRIFGLSASLLNEKCKPRNLEKKICDLEKTLRSTVETASDINNLRRYGTDPTEYLLFYNKYTNPFQGELTADLKVALQKIKNELYVYEDKEGEGDDVVFFKVPSKCLEQVLRIYTDLGTWCALKAAEIFIKEMDCLLKRLRHKTNEDIITCAKNALQEFQSMCWRRGENTFQISKRDALPHKLQRFIEIFHKIKQNVHILGSGPNTKKCSPEQDVGSSFCGIVFVEERIVAYILTHFVLEAQKYYPELEYLCPGFVVGHGNFKSAGCTETSMSVKKQKEVIESFHVKTLNLLIATSVIEEGMDIPKCNVVIRFDLPKDFRSYVQSKGRGRSQHALYILMADYEQRDDVFSNLSNYITIEAMLIKRCRNRKMPSEEAIEEYMDDDLLPPYMPVKAVGKPRITFTSAISVVNRYCAKLPSDMPTKLTPKYKIKVYDEECLKKEYICILRLPMNSCVKHDIVGERMPRIRAAKMAAALKACQLLDEHGELDDHFVPRSHLVDEALDKLLGDLAEGVEESTPGGPEPGTKARRQLYQKGIAEVFKNSLPVPGERCFLHVLEMDLIVPLPKKWNPKGRPIVNPAETTLGIGILSKKKIPAVCKFPVYTRSGVVSVQMKLAAENLLYNEEQLEGLAEFHNFIFRDALLLEDKKKYFCPKKADFSIFIVPVNKGNDLKYHVDWEFITHTKSHDYNVDKWRLKKNMKHVKYEKKLFADSVVTRAYKIDWDTEFPAFHYVNKIADDLSVASKIEIDSPVTFKEYYSLKYELTVQFEDQPLLLTERIASLNLWKPSERRKDPEDLNTATLSKTKRKKLNYREYLIPEFCIIHPFPSAFFRKVICIPTILFRLNSLLLAEQLRQLVAMSAGFGIVNLPDTFEWPFFDVETKKSADTSVKFQQDSDQMFQSPRDLVKSYNSIEQRYEITSFEAQPELCSHPGPNPSFILQALTPKSTGDVFNLERLETIGDSFLKYAMSVKIYVTFPNFDEGKLTRLRIGLVRNLYLYSSAKKKSLQQYMICEPFLAQTSWLPPCYFVNSEDESDIAEKSEEINSENNVSLFLRQEISDKSIADSVEALIGVYLLSCGHLGALHFMHWLGLNAFADNESDFSNWPPEPKSPLLVDRPDLLFHLTSGMDRFEKKIGYQFKDKAYLVQAFTHPSYNDNEITDCYQRLEFLGDSVLDYLITRKLYDDPKQHSPGELTDLRSALVNNAYFASLAIKYEYHRFLKNRSPVLFTLINEYVKMLENTEAFEKFKEFGYYLEELECFFIEEVEVPKALGDIFESVAGAIYLDSGMSLDAVWSVCYPMMKPAIDHMSVHVPKSPVRELYEAVPSKLHFGNPVVGENGKVTVQLTLPGGKVFSGIGPNKSVAKRSCAKRALSYLRKSTAS